MHTLPILFRRAACALAALALCLSVAKAGNITQNAQNFGIQIDYAEPVGQSFTAEDANILSIGFFVSDWNTHVGPLTPITVTLFGGAGFGGPVMGSADLQGLTPNYHGWFYADFSTVGLIVGNVYTASLTALSARGGVYGYSAGSVYAGGDAYTFGGVNTNSDLQFEVLAAANVPDSAVTVPFLLTLLGLAVTRRSLRR